MALRVFPSGPTSASLLLVAGRRRRMRSSWLAGWLAAGRRVSCCPTRQEEKKFKLLENKSNSSLPISSKIAIIFFRHLARLEPLLTPSAPWPRPRPRRRASTAAWEGLPRRQARRATRLSGSTTNWVSNLLTTIFNKFQDGKIGEFEDTSYARIGSGGKAWFGHGFSQFHCVASRLR